MSIQAIRPHIRFACETTELSIRAENSKCYDCRLFLIKQGHGTVLVNETEYDFSNDYILFFPPETEYRFLPVAPHDVRILIFDFDLTDKYRHISTSLGTPEAASYVAEKMPKYPIPTAFQAAIIQKDVLNTYEHLKLCSTEFVKKDAYSAEMSAALLQYCLFKLLQNRRAAHNAYFALANSVADFLQTHYDNPDLRNEEIAAAFGYHPYYLNTLYKKATGTTLRKALCRYRIQVAKGYLAATDMRVDTIFWKVGFHTASHFIQAFKAETGVSPRNYRIQRQGQ